MIIRMYVKKELWKWWMRFLRPVKTFYTSGCTDNFCGPYVDDGCRCNDFYAERKKWLAKGFKEAGYFWPFLANGPKYVWTNGKKIAFEHHVCGR